MNWEKTCNRYIAYIDLFGFKDIIQNDTHNEILKKLEMLKKATENVDNELYENQKQLLKIESNQTKSVVFSDSIILFSRESTIEDFFKIISDSYSIRKMAIKNNIAIRVAISYGKITCDFEKSLFLGQPINDAFLLLEDLFYLSIILDYNAEKKVNTYKNKKILRDSLQFRKADMEGGSVVHTIISSAKKEIIDEDISILKKFYNVSSAAQKLFIDNTLDYYDG